MARSSVTLTQKGNGKGRRGTDLENSDEPVTGYEPVVDTLLDRTPHSDGSKVVKI